MARQRRIDIVTNPAFDSLLVEAQWRALKRGVPVCSRTQLIELGVAILAALEQHLEACQYQPFLPREVIAMASIVTGRRCVAPNWRIKSIREWRK